MFTDIFGEASDRAGLLAGAMEMIAEEGTGVIVVLNRAMTDGRLGRVMAARAAGQPPETIPEIMELRDYGVGAQILTELGVQDMVLLTNSHHQLVALDGYGLSIVGERPIPSAGTGD
jgi:3,4-dihydroxy 2-butanone 4-phosphate synthase/GTP cyclohydrolase II